MGNFAVVGGSGFIGSHFVDYLVSQGHNVTVVDNHCSGTLNHIHQHLNKDYFRLFTEDAQNTDALVKILQGVDTVIHLASNPDISRAETFPRIDFEQGTKLTESVLEACRISDVANVLYASGSGVYANEELVPLSEDSKLQPISTYGASKLAGESLMSSYSFMFGIKAISFRFANVVGARQTHGVGYDFLRKLRENPNKLKVLGNGKQCKSYIHVSDIINGVMTAFHKSDSIYSVYNIATKDTLTVSTICEIVLDELGLNSNTTQITYGESDRGWKADVPKIELDTTKLRNLGWTNKFNSEDAFRLSIRAMNQSMG